MLVAPRQSHHWADCLVTMGNHHIMNRLPRRLMILQNR